MPKVLVADDSPVNLELMTAYLDGLGVEVITAKNGGDALAGVRESHPDLVLLDVMMPGLDGFEVCRQIKDDPATRMLPVVMVTALNETLDRVEALDAGADDFISKPVERVEIVARVRSLLRLKALYDRLDDSERVMVALARAVEAKDAHTEAHVERVGRMARRLAEVRGEGGLDLDVIYLGGVLHDIGKIGVPDAILNKPGRLTPAELEVVRSHVIIGVDIVRPLRSAAAVLPIVRHHHERVDGEGYPDGLAGEQIPLEARIVAVCDAWDAMTSVRPYRAALGEAAAAALLSAGAGSQWDAELVKTLLAEVAAGALPGSHGELGLQR